MPALGQRDEERVHFYRKFSQPTNFPISICAVEFESWKCLCLHIVCAVLHAWFFLLYSWCLLFDSLFCNFNIIIPSASIWLRWWSVICRWRGRERLTTLLVCLLPAWLSFWPKKNTPRESQRVHVIKLQLDDGGGINLWIHCGEAGGKIQSECKF